MGSPSNDERRKKLVTVMDVLIERVEDNMRFGGSEELAQLTDALYNVSMILADGAY